MSAFPKIDEIQLRLLEEVADLHEVPEGAYNIRANGKLADRVNSANIEIVSKEDGTGIDIHIKPGTKKESVHIPVVLSQSGLSDLVYNDFYVGDDADVVIVAGCGIHNGGDQDSRHDGIHRFWLGKNAKVKYVEKHYGEGDGKGKRILNPVTEVTMDENSYMEMEMVQIKGVDSTQRMTKADLAAGAKLIIRERLLTHGDQHAESLGVKAEFVEIDWDNKIMELDGKTIDCVWNGMTLTDEVTSSMACSDAYCNNAQVVIVPKDKADKYQTVDSIKELTFAVEAGSAGEDQAKALGLNYTAVKAQADALMEVAAGTSDAAIIDSLMAAAMVGEGTGYDKLTYTVGLNSEEYGVGFRKDSDLVAELNKFFADSKADGSMEKCAETYKVQAALAK